MIPPSHSAAVIATTAVVLTCCGPSTDPGEPECGIGDVTTEARVVTGIGGPPCDPCPTDADLYIAATLSTECGPVQWQTYSTCLVASVRATRVADDHVDTLDRWFCSDAITDWRVSPGEELVVHTPPLADVFGAPIIPAGTYSFEVAFPANLEIEPAVVEATLEAPPA